jgi:hypothetical protein
VREAVDSGKLEGELLARTNSECVLLAIGEWNGASNLENAVLHFPQRTVVYCGGKFLDNARPLACLCQADKTNCALRLLARYLAFCRYKCLRLRMALLAFVV